MIKTSRNAHGTMSFRAKQAKAKQAKAQYQKKYHRDWRPYQEKAYSRKG